MIPMALHARTRREFAATTEFGVRPLSHLFGDIVMTHCAINAFDILRMRQLNAGKITVAINAIHLSVDRRQIFIVIDEYRNFLACTSSTRIRIFMAHHAVIIGLRTGGQGQCASQ